MSRHMRNGLVAGLFFVVAACASARRPSDDVASAPLFDPTAHASLFRQLDSAMADTAMWNQFERMRADTAVWNHFDRVRADTAVWRRLESAMNDTAVHARLRQLRIQADSLWVRLQPQAGAIRRP